MSVQRVIHLEFLTFLSVCILYACCRLVEDGRVAGTVRLTIRRLSAENKYLNRESKQCNIPSHVISKLSKGIILSIYR